MQHSNKTMSFPGFPFSQNFKCTRRFQFCAMRRVRCCKLLGCFTCPAVHKTVAHVPRVQHRTRPVHFKGSGLRVLYYMRSCRRGKSPSDYLMALEHAADRLLTGHGQRNVSPMILHDGADAYEGSEFQAHMC